MMMVGIGIAATSAIAFSFASRTPAAKRLIAMHAQPPVAEKSLHKVKFGKVEGENRGPNPMDPPLERDDEYFWMRDDDRKSAKVINHIKAENKYTEKMTAHLKGLQDQLYQEYLGHFKETDAKVPYKHGDYFYFSRTEQGKSYPIYCRSTEFGGPEQVILDVNQLAEGQKYCDVGDWSPDPKTHGILAYSVDFSGYETYEVLFKDLATGELLQDRIPNTSGSVEWGKDRGEVYYTTLDDAHRPYKLWRHRLGTPVAEDELLFTEEDEKFWSGIGKTDSGRFLVLSSGGKETSESHFIDLESEDRVLQPVAPRRHGVRYSVEHWGEDFFIVTNADDCTEYKLVKTPVVAPGAENWKDVFPYDPKTKVSYVSCFANHLVLSGRADGLKRFWVLNPRDLAQGKREIEMPEPIYSLSGSNNYVFDTDKFRFGYSSLTTPTSVFDYDLNQGTMECLKEEEVPNYERGLYTSERTMATARDGTRVMLSLVYRKDAYPQGKENGPMPVFLYSYGSYGHSIDPTFSFTRLSYLDRGVVFCIAHIRGGGEMGQYWYEKEGKYLTKKNTFNDFADSAEHLIQEGWTTSDKLAICGRSAGGLLIGATVNLRPDLFKIAVADVPFVDVMNTMCDPSIPLTVTEWEEWGNPNEEKYYQYMSEYSPYDNVGAKSYPFMLITGGLNDPRVAYWEPLKWAARLRARGAPAAAAADGGDGRRKNPVLVKIDMDSGHFSASDRYHYLRETAFEMAVVLDQLGAADLLPAASPPAPPAAAAP